MARVMVRKTHLFRRRRGVVYRAIVHHPTRCDHLNGVCRPAVGYVGESIQRPKARWNEHVHGTSRYEKPKPPVPWADTIIRWEVIREWDATWDWWRLWREYQEIKLQRPLYNVKHNQNNPHRIPPWEARRQRESRDAGLRPNVTAPVRSAARDPGRPRSRARRSPGDGAGRSGIFFEGMG